VTDTANRILWTLIGLLLLAAGVGLLLVHLGRLPGVPSDSSLLSTELIESWHRADNWNLGVLIAVGVLLFVLGLWLFIRQFRLRTVPSLSNLQARGEEPVRWRTHINSSALVGALERDLTDGSQVAAARVVMTGRSPHPEAWVRLDLAPGVVVSDVRERVDESLDRFEATTGMRPDRIDVTVRPSRRRASRVR
jgi:hypothetical protein